MTITFWSLAQEAANSMGCMPLDAYTILLNREILESTPGHVVRTPAKNDWGEVEVPARTEPVRMTPGTLSNANFHLSFFFLFDTWGMKPQGRGLGHLFA